MFTDVIGVNFTLKAVFLNKALPTFYVLSKLVLFVKMIEIGRNFKTDYFKGFRRLIFS